MGILGTMLDKFTVDLATSQQADLASEINFQKLRAAKLDEISAATSQRDSKQTRLADLLDRSAKATEDIASLEDALTADQKFLMNLDKNCAKEQEEYDGRVKIRNDELQALAETLRILAEDDARDVFGRTMSFLQTSESQRLAVQDRAAERAMQRIAKIATSHGNWALAGLAVRMRLAGQNQQNDSPFGSTGEAVFNRVKQLMDKMMALLDQQQKDEDDKRAFCNTEIDRTEDDIKVQTQTKADLDLKHKSIVNQLDALSAAVDELTTDVHDNEISLKQAGEARKEENHVFQTAVADQHSMVHILEKAQSRLREFYQEAALMQVRKHGQPEPGAYVAPPPPSPKGYSKSAGAGGVDQLLSKIIGDAKSEVAEMGVSENNAQASYSSYVRDTTASIEANRRAIEEKMTQIAHLKGEKSETQESQRATTQELATSTQLLAAHHGECDYLLKYYEIRKKARAEEKDAIDDAKAILSGADYGK